MPMQSTVRLLLMAVWLAGCATLGGSSLDTLHGPADPARYDRPVASAAGVSWRHDVQPLLERRCVLCHACYDAPCQLKLGAFEGVARGASKERVYDSTRLREAEPTRLGIDAGTPSEWRGRGFAPVLNERSPAANGDLAASILWRALALKQDHPLPATPVLPDSFDFRLDRKQSCPTIEEYPDYARKFPLAGMPYGLPGLTDAELTVVARWLAAGAPYEGPPPVTTGQAREIARWESFLNGDTPKERLMARYLYEHLFLGHIYFDTDPDRRPFRLVRSRTPPGEPVSMIATRRPYEDPGVARPWYRLVPEGEVLVEKTHMPYLLSGDRMAKYRGWFLERDYPVGELPSYETGVAANPFVAFRDIPPDSRYRFLLDEAEFFVMNFIKGPVCRGQLALDVIQDRFWVFFADPDVGAEGALAELLVRQSENLRLPAEWGGNAPVLRAWREYARLERAYVGAKSEALSAAARRRPPGLDLIWDGGGVNPNAALTVFRHFDSASVTRGLVGEPPDTAWVIGYPLFERIFYLLVAGYDVYGNLGHQLDSRLYMDFLRMEGEFLFISLLPEAARIPTRDRWYRGASDEVKEQVYGSTAFLDAGSAIEYRTADPQAELFALLRARLAPVLDRRYDLEAVDDAGLRAGLAALTQVRGPALAYLPETVFLRVDEAGLPARYFTLLRDTGHSNVSTVFRETAALVPEENALVVVPGFLGAYPNAFYRIDRDELPALAAAIAGLRSEDDYAAMADRFAIRRTDPSFWRWSDELLQARGGPGAGPPALPDYGRLENR
jgi:hypothetical protein